MSLEFVTLAERPDLVDAMWSMHNPWPAFMLHDPLSNALFGRLPETFPACQLLAVDDDGEIVAKLHAVPFAWAGTDEDLPDRGLDAIITRAFGEHAHGTRPRALSLLEARIVPAHRGGGLSYRLLDPWLRAHARLGARIVKVCPLSMVIPGTVGEWREWTGLELATSGAYEVEGALAPVHVSVEHDHGLYAEPNVWMHHALSVNAPA